MSRSGYSDDYEHLALYRQAVHLATTGHRGQAFLRKLRDALDAMPVKRLITDQIRNDSGEVCALGALDPTADDYAADGLARHFGIARSLAAEIVYVNDEWWTNRPETPEERWTRVRSWVDRQLLKEPPADDAVAGHSA